MLSRYKDNETFESFILKTCHDKMKYCIIGAFKKFNFRFFFEFDKN